MNIQEEMKSNAVDNKIRENRQREKVRKRHSKLIKALIIIPVIIVIAVFAALSVNYYIVKPAKKKVAKQLATSTFSQALKESGADGDTKAQAEKIVDSMSESDKSTVEKIVDNHSSPKETTEIAKIYKEEGVSGVKQYAEENLTDQEIQELKDLYEKYKDKVVIDQQ